MICAALVPKRIVLSRKGFDLSSGGCASPVLNGEMISLPIPEHNADQRKCACYENHRCSERHLTFGDLRNSFDKNEGKQIAELAIQLSKGKIRECDCVHLDPDIRPELREEKDRLSPLTFGQSSRSQTLLKNKEVQEGDLFLFFGWFRKAHEFTLGSFCFDKGEPDVHAIWGWLQITEKLDLPSKLEKAKKIAGHHPHVSYPADNNPNCLYVAGETLSFLPKYTGAGVFPKFHDGLLLSNKQKTLRSQWRLPAFFKEINMTCLPDPPKWALAGKSIVGDGAKGRGQEFIFETTDHENDVAKWLEGIFSGERRQYA
jgi:hypothetical protein